MTDDPKKRFRKAADQIDLNLNGLLGSLGDALNEAVNRLEQVADSDQRFDLGKDPLRAKAGIRIRTAGLSARAAQEPKPVNPARKPPPSPAAKPATFRPLAMDLLEDMGSWLATAEMPGVTLSDLELTIDGDSLVVRSSGAAAYLGRITLPFPCQADQIGRALNNGILTLQLPGKAAE